MERTHKKKKIKTKNAELKKKEDSVVLDERNRNHICIGKILVKILFLSGDFHLKLNSTRLLIFPLFLHCLMRDVSGTVSHTSGVDWNNGGLFGVFFF